MTKKRFLGLTLLVLVIAAQLSVTASGSEPPIEIPESPEPTTVPTALATALAQQSCPRFVHPVWKGEWYIAVHPVWRGQRPVIRHVDEIEVDETRLNGPLGAIQDCPAEGRQTRLSPVGGEAGHQGRTRVSFLRSFPEPN